MHKIILFGICLLSVFGFARIKASSVDLPGFGEYQDGLASYAYNACKDKKDRKDYGRYTRRISGSLVYYTADYTCEGFILTLNSENGGWNKNKFSPKNSNGTRDFGLCQLNTTHHGEFIYSDESKDAKKQIDYCLSLWKSSADRSLMPRYGHEVRKKRNKGIKFIKNKQEIHNTDELYTPPAVKKGTPKIKIKKVCRIENIKIQEGEYIELTYLGKIRQVIRSLRYGDELRVCRDI